MAATEQLTLRIPPDLKAKLLALAQRDRASLNQKTIDILTAWCLGSPQNGEHGHEHQSDDTYLATLEA